MQRLGRIGIGVGVAMVALISVIVVIAVATKGGEAEYNKEPWLNIRLPDNIRADKYRMQLNLDWEKWNYTGVQEVTMNVTANTKFFIIHSSGLTLGKTSLFDVTNNASLAILRTFTDAEEDAKLKHDFYIVESEKVVGEGQYKMTIDFAGAIQTDKLVGMYRSGYTRDDGSEIYQVSTDFEPVDARTAFPCFDEPAQKAKWETTISVTFPDEINVSDYSIVSNMPLKDGGEKKSGSTITASFQESVAMSTYLVCFAVSDFVPTTGVYKRDDDTVVNLGVLTRREQDFQDSAAYALKVTQDILKEYEKFYKVRYPLPKLDQIALPDFNSGAMENWGLITYRESSLLYNSKTSSKNEKQRVCAVIAHEVAHQWFGNIVTMAWWNDLWLNEGFASFVEYYGIDAAEKDWGILNFFYDDEMVTAMNADSSPSSHPISVSVESPDELSGLFDTISYRKGSSINYMMLNFMGEEAFASGLETYFERYKWGNTAMVDLFDAMQSANTNSKINITEIMLTWTLQMGFPYVDVVLQPSKDGSKTTIKLTQSRFLKGDQLPDDVSDFGYKWHIPFTYLKEGTDSYSNVTWLTPEKDETLIEEEGDLDWIKGNGNGNFYYITNYEKPVWQELSKKLSAGSIQAPTDKSSLIYDAFSLAEIGKLDYGTALELTRYGINETEYTVLSRILNNVLSAGNTIQGDKDAMQKFWSYVASMLKPRIAEVGWTGDASESITMPKLRDMVIRNYCRAVANETDPVVVQALEKFNKFADDPSKDNKAEIADVFVSITRTAIIYDNETDTNWHKMWDLLQNSEWEADQKNYMAALARSTNTTLLEWMVERSFDDNVRGDTWRYLYYVHVYGRQYDLSWKLLKKHWDKYAKKYNTSSFTMGYLTGMPGVFETTDMLNKVKEFFDSKSDNIGTGLKASKEALTEIQSNIKWRSKNADAVKTWFADL